jgi:hypothetical protein
MSDVERIANRQVVGNVGLFFVCYRLSRFGWNVMPTTRNARGVDILIYSQESSPKERRTKTIQVKTISKERDSVPLGKKSHSFADVVIVCRNIRPMPECFILKPEEVCRLAYKDRKSNYWLKPCAYAVEEFRENWNRIGSGHAELRDPPDDFEPDFGTI